MLQEAASSIPGADLLKLPFLRQEAQMLKKLTLSNFKAWEQVDLQLGKITGIFGANSAGKSSLLQFLLLLKQTKNATDRGLVLDFGSSTGIVNFGSFRNVVHRHDPERRVSWTLDWTLPSKLTTVAWSGPKSATVFRGDSLQTSCEVGLRQERLWPHLLAYRFSEADFSLKAQPSPGDKFFLETHNDRGFQFKRNKGRAWSLPDPVKTHLFPDEVRHFYRNAGFLSRFELAYERLMDSIYYLGPLRDYPRREYGWTGSSPDDVGQRGELTIGAMLSATRDSQMRSLGHRRRRKPFQEMIAHWLSELRLIQDFRLEEIAAGTNLYRAVVKTSRWSVPTALTDVGFGVSQVLPAVVLLYYVPEGSTVLLEQPEIHLHPAVQSGLADVMLSVAKARNVQIIVESHSEHLLRRLQRRVAEGEASSEDVKMYFVSPSGYKARLSDLTLNTWGEIENWPERFFGDEMGEIGAIATASLRRRQAP
jgi:hypothetical protein